MQSLLCSSLGTLGAKIRSEGICRKKIRIGLGAVRVNVSQFPLVPTHKDEIGVSLDV